jgi:hypothetical protein
MGVRASAPLPGGRVSVAVVADLATLKTMLGIKSTNDDAILTTCLSSADAWTRARVYTEQFAGDDVQHAMLLIASRLYKRRESPEGVAGWDDIGQAVTIVARDPDIERLLEQHIDTYHVYGIS